LCRVVRTPRISVTRPQAFYSVDTLTKKTLEKNNALDVSLNNLRDNPGAKRKRIRVGRGPGSGRGKTAGRGGKGQTARSGSGVRIGFEGGQTPQYRRYRKYGFTNARFKREYNTVNLDRLQLWIDSKRLDPTQKITMRTMFEAKLVSKLKRKQVGIKLLGTGSDIFKAKVNVEVSQASGSAIQTIEKNGGSVKLVYYDRAGLRSLLHPEMMKAMPYLSPPPAKINRKLHRPMVQPEQHNQWLGIRKQYEEKLGVFKNTSQQSKVEEL